MAISGYAQVGYDPTQRTLDDEIPTMGVGEFYRHAGRTYQYVRFNNGAGNVASVAGRAAYWRDSSAFEVTMDKTDNEAGAAVAAGCAGIFLGVVTDLRYTLIQTGGTRATVRLNGAGAAGNKVHAPAADTDGTLTTVTFAGAAGEAIPAPIVGIQAAAADASNDAEVYLMIA